MEWLSAPEYWLARWLFTRALGAIYLIAFLNAALEFRALVGEGGLLPATRFLDRVSFRSAPSVFHWHYSDRFASGLAWFGVALSASVVAGLPETGPVWVTMLVWLVLWFAYLSFVSVGQIFYAFGWESILLEAGFVAVFLGPSDMAPPILTIFVARWLLFRVEFGAGLIKLRGDQCWRDLTCLEYHHETQPLPNPVSWFAHHLPTWFHRGEVLGNYVAQLAAPLALFAPQPVASIAGGVIVVTQGWLVVTGNFAWLNVLTMALAIPAFDNGVLDAIVPANVPELTASPLWFDVTVLVFTAAVAIMSWWPIRNMTSRGQRMNQTFNPLHLVGTYGAFGSVTKERYEVVVEGTDVASPSQDDWRAYEFRGKPTDPRRPPAQVAPYHLRLDWLMWFAAMSSPRRHPWFVRLVDRLLEADPATLKLLKRDPFDGAPPDSVRARLFLYRYTTWDEWRETGAWWSREEVRTYLPARTRSSP